MTDEPTFDLTVPGLTASDLCEAAANPAPKYSAAAKAKLAEIDAERAAAVKATERMTIQRIAVIGDGGGTKLVNQVLASDLRPGDVVEGRTVTSTYVGCNGGATTQVAWGGDRRLSYYPPGVLVLLESEGK